MKNLTTRSVAALALVPLWVSEFHRCLRRFVDHNDHHSFECQFHCGAKGARDPVGQSCNATSAPWRRRDGIDFAVGEHFVDPSGTPFNRGSEY